jgi:hypothetical protein
MPLSALIADRVRYARTQANFKLPSVIRDVMKDIEEIARFQAPKYLSCYMDIYAEVVGSEVGGIELDIAMMLELGVSRQTEVSMISLGLSRMSAVALSAYIASDNLSPESCLDWLTHNNYQNLDLPTLVIAEIARSVKASS